MECVLAGKVREEVAELAASGPQEAAIGGDPHHHLCDAEGDDLGVAEPTPRVTRALRQQVVGSAVDTDQEQVEVGVHRGLLVDGVVDTADFDLLLLVPIATASAVASII